MNPVPTSHCTIGASIKSVLVFLTLGVYRSNECCFVPPIRTVIVLVNNVDNCLDQTTGPDGTVAKSSANGLVGRYWICISIPAVTQREFL